jgi:hypothetical protein
MTDFSVGKTGDHRQNNLTAMEVYHTEIIYSIPIRYGIGFKTRFRNKLARHANVDTQ